MPDPTVDSPSVLIVGAGPGGLAVAGRLRQRGVAFEVLEKGERPGESWHNHYDRLHLHTIKELSHLPDRPFPASFPRYIPRAQLAQYYVDYAREHSIHPHFNSALESLVSADGEWVAHTIDGATFRAQHVVVATGVNRLPNIPSYANQELFEGRILHSREYRNADPFIGKRVLVVGMGNTGAEVALDLCENGVQTTLSVRGPVNAIPRDVLGWPTHLTARTLGKLPPWLAGPIGATLRRFTVGDLTQYGIATPTIPPIEQLRVHGKTPVVDIGTIRRIKRGDIRVFPAIQRFEPGAVVFADGRHQAIDAVVLATGYRAQVRDFLPECDDLLDHNCLPARVIGEGRFSGLYFTGFDNYQPGGVLGTILVESEQIADAIASAVGYDATS